MLRMPTSTADTVAYACWPASSGTLTVTRLGRSGRICSGALRPTATRRALRSIGTHATPTARAGVILHGALPPRNTTVRKRGVTGQRVWVCGEVVGGVGIKKKRHTPY